MPPVSTLFQRAANAHNAGDLATAAKLYAAVLKAEPNHVPALKYSGLVHLTGRRWPDARKALERGAHLAPTDGEMTMLLGVALSELGDLGGAVAAYRRSLAVRDDPETHLNLGNALARLGEAANAERHFRAALARAPRSAGAAASLARLLAERGDHDEAIALFSQALAAHPGHAPAQVGLALSLLTRGRADEAESAVKAVLARHPDFPPALNAMGVILAGRGAPAEALPWFQRAVAVQPDADFLMNAGQCLGNLERRNEALDCYRRTEALAPGLARVHLAMAELLFDLMRFEEADACLRRGLAVRPDDCDLLLRLGKLCAFQGQVIAAGEAYRKALALRPGHPAALFGLAMAQLPVIGGDPEQVLSARRAYGEHLGRVAAAFDAQQAEKSLPIADWAATLGRYQPFYLPYQGENDAALQRIYGGLNARIAALADPRPAPQPTALEGRRIRVGIASAYFRYHSVWKIPLRGWVSQLDRSRFELFLYHLGSTDDACTAEARDFADHFVRGPLPLERWRQIIRDDGLDVLLYPEIGMHALTEALSAHRLAPVQCISLGHPITTGSPAMDYFLSSDLMEPEDAEAHYSERLVRLPNIGVYYHRPTAVLPEVSRDRLGLGGDHVAYWSCQSLFKYIPRYDEVFPRIARRVPRATFVFVKDVRPAVTQAFEERLGRAFAAHGMDARVHCLLLERMSEAQFAAVGSVCDVFLDNIGWSGFNSTIENLANDLPVVTLAAPMMRGRHTTAVLRMMGVEDTIATSVDAFVDIAARLGTDPIWRAEIRALMAERKERVFEDRASITALEDFLEGVARSGGAQRPAE